MNNDINLKSNVSLWEVSYINYANVDVVLSDGHADKCQMYFDNYEAALDFYNQLKKYNYYTVTEPIKIDLFKENPCKDMPDITYAKVTISLKFDDAVYNKNVFKCDKKTFINDPNNYVYYFSKYDYSFHNALSFDFNNNIVNDKYDLAATILIYDTNALFKELLGKDTPYLESLSKTPRIDSSVYTKYDYEYSKIETIDDLYDELKNRGFEISINFTLTPARNHSESELRELITPHIKNAMSSLKDKLLNEPISCDEDLVKFNNYIKNIFIFNAD